MTCPNCGAKQPEESNRCSGCDSILQKELLAEQSSEENTGISEAVEQDLPMKWFKFLINFSLFFGAFVNGITAYQYFNKTMTYNLFGEYFRSIDIIYGISILTIAVLMLIARFRLSGFKKNGPAFFCGLCILSIIVSAAYIIAAINIIGFYPYITDANRAYYVYTLTLSSVITFATYIVFVVLNIRYFSKRKHLFCK